MNKMLRNKMKKKDHCILKILKKKGKNLKNFETWISGKIPDRDIVRRERK